MKKIIIVNLVLCFGSIVLAQVPVKYSIYFPNYVHHEAEVEVEFSNLPRNPLEIRMSRTSPGRYALHEFSKNVYNIRIMDGKGKKLNFTQPNLHQWTVTQHNGTVKIQYTIFGDHNDGTYLGIDRTHAHMNIPATFMWALGLEDRPIEIVFHPPVPEWKIVTQLFPTKSATVFTAPDLQYFMDSPVEISNFSMREWQVKSGTKKQTIRLAVHHQGTEAELDAYTEMVKAVVDEQITVFGEIPDFENSTYTFIADYLPHVRRDAMEHRNSTILTRPDALKDKATTLISVVAHEFFHIWNIERIRPQSLEPFDFKQVNISGELWFGEGFTNYYEGLTLVRSGIYSLDKYAESVGKTLNAVLNLPGNKIRSAAEMSRYAPFVDAGRSIDSKNLANTYISYYPFGEVIGLGLDLTLRQKFMEVTLDDVMRAAWDKFGKSETPYTNADLQKLLGEVTGDTKFTADFFAKYVYGHEMQDYKMLLAQGGLSLRKAKKGKAWLGSNSIKFDDEKMVVSQPVLSGTPLYDIGVNQNDTILRLDEKSLKTREEYDAWIAACKPGQIVEIEYESLGQTKNTKLTLVENPKLELVLFEHEAREITPEIQAFRDDWLKTKTARDVDSLVRYCPKCKRAFPFRFEFCQYDGNTLALTKP